MSTPLMTPQQVEEISFRHATFGGYDVQSVDEVLGRLADDYNTVYKENSLLKSKMRVLVAKLEEYRTNEDTMRDAILGAQKTCDKMIQETEEKCTKMLSDVSEMAAENTRNAEAAMAMENARVEEARRSAAEVIDKLTRDLNSCLQVLEQVRAANLPAAEESPIYDYDQEPDEDAAAAVADEISQSLESLVGPAEEDDLDPDIPPMVSDATSKFTGLADHFGPDYDPTTK